MPSTLTLASRHTAKASGSTLSSDSPLATRWRNSGVLALSSASDSACICGSRALIFLTIPPNCLTRRSLRLPKTLVSRRLSIGVPDTVTGTWPGPGRRAGIEKGRDWRPFRWQRALYRGGARGRLQGRRPQSGPARPPRRWLPERDLAQELARVVQPPVLPDLQVHVDPGGTPGRAGLGHLLAGAHQVAHLHRVAGVVGVAGDEAVAVVDLDHVAIAAAHARIADHAIGHAHHRVAGPGVEIDALVELVPATERIG